MKPIHMLTDADIITITEIVSGSIETLTLSMSKMEKDIHFLKNQVGHINKSLGVIRADLTNVHQRLDLVESRQADTISMQ